MFLILKSLQTLVCLKFAPSGNTLIFGPISFAPPTLSLTLLLKTTEFLSLICLRILLFPTDLRLSGLNILFFEVISELIERGCVEKVLNPSRFINSLRVVQQSDGKCKLILDLSYLNRFIWKKSVRFEDIRTMFDLFQSGYFFFTIDLKYGYHHVEIFPDHRQYLSFSWNFGSVVKFFVFIVLAFGLSSAQYIFSKLVRSLVNYWCG